MLGVAGMPVIKSWVINVLITADLWHDGFLDTTSLSKCIGIRIMGICEILPIWPLLCRIEWATKSTWRRVLKTIGVKYVGVISWTGYVTAGPNM